jgi:membrane protein DedA with SNARE-associated domain
MRYWVVPGFFLAITLDAVEQWLTAGGYLMLFGLLFLCGLGLPLPEDIPLMASGVLIANGKMHFAVAAVCAWCGIIGGDCVLYHLGRKFGLEITRVPFVGKHVTRERIERAERLFEKYGIWVVAVGRLFAGIRGAMVVAAGATRYNFAKFLIADGLAALVSGGLFMWLGHWLGNRLKEHMGDIERYKHYFFAGAVVLAILFGLFFWWRHRRRAAAAAAQATVPTQSDSQASA